MRIGIVPALDGSGGGIYQYSLTMLRALHEEAAQGGEDEFVILADDPRDPSVVSFRGPRWDVKPMHPSGLRRLAKRVGGRLGLMKPLTRVWGWFHSFRWKGSNPATLDMVRAKPTWGQWFRHFGIDLMLYPFPYPLSFETGIPYVMAIHDLQHRLQPEFPEVSQNGEWESREYLFRNGARQGTVLVADSEVGKEDILRFYGPYGVTPDRVKVLPFLPAAYLPSGVSECERQRVRATYRLPERYLFYPAQFWPHKNHARIVEALGVLKQKHGLRPPIVFCGSHSGGLRRATFLEVRSRAGLLGIQDQIHYLGYVPDRDMAALYAGAVALLMPTFFGPTNIPVLEAWAFGCPVMTSDIRGIREQAGDAAVLVDPHSVEAIAEATNWLWTDDSWRRTLVERGRRRLAAYGPNDYRRRLMDILEEAKTRVLSERPAGVKR
jgi:glycosyltransferase involved in cell wall biosynthesis